MQLSITSCAHRSVLILLSAGVERLLAPAVWQVVGEVAADPRVEDLAHRDGPVASLLEILRQSGEVPRRLPPVGVEVVELGGVWPPGGEERVPAGRTQCLLGVCSVIHGAQGAQEVEIGRDQRLCPVDALGRAQVIHDEKQHVWGGNDG